MICDLCETKIGWFKSLFKGHKCNDCYDDWKNERYINIFRRQKKKGIDRLQQYYGGSEE